MTPDDAVRSAWQSRAFLQWAVGILVTIIFGLLGVVSLGAPAFVRGVASNEFSRAVKHMDASIEKHRAESVHDGAVPKDTLLPMLEEINSRLGRIENVLYRRAEP